MDNPAGYFDCYYAENKYDLNERRRRRYHSDPEYREKVLNMSKEYRDRKRQGQPPRARMPRHQAPLRAKTGDGGTIKLFSVGAFAVFLGRSVQSIKHWEKKPAVLPITPYRDSRDFRFYTKEMMEAVKEVVGTKRRLFPIDPQMYLDIKAAWEALGVPVGRVKTGDKSKKLKLALAKTITK